MIAQLEQGGLEIVLLMEKNPSNHLEEVQNTVNNGGKPSLHNDCSRISSLNSVKRHEKKEHGGMVSPFVTRHL